MSRNYRSNQLVSHHNSRLSSRISGNPNDLREKVPHEVVAHTDSNSKFVSESQRSDWVFSNPLGDSSATSFSKVKTPAWGDSTQSTMTLKEISATGKSGSNPIARLWANLHMTKCKVFILTLATGMFCLGIPLTAVLTVWSATGFTGRTNAPTSMSTIDVNVITTSIVGSTGSTISTGTTITQTTTSCATSAAGRGSLLSLSGTTPSSWTGYRFNYTATVSRPILIFGFQTENNRQYYLDSVSVVDKSAPSVELLQNPGFENSTGTPVGWVQWCTSSCSGRSGTVSKNSTCFSSTGNCFVDNCYASSGIDFLGQSFPAIIGGQYNISFWVLAGGSGVSTSNRFYVDIAS